MVLEYKSLTRTGSKPVSATGKAKRKTFCGSAGLALGLGTELAETSCASSKKENTRISPKYNFGRIQFELARLTVKQSTKFTEVL